MRSLFSVVFVFLLCGSLLGVHTAEAQDRGYAMIRSPVRSGAELADSILSGRSGFVRVSPAQYLSALQAADPAAEIRTASDIRPYLASLSVVRCPAGKGVLSRVMLPSGRLDFSWERDFEEGEMCLYNNNTNRLVLSLTCGNTIHSPRTLPQTAQVPVREVERIVRDTVRITDTVYIRVPAPTVKDTVSILVTKDSIVVTNGHRMLIHFGELRRIGSGEVVREVYEMNSTTLLLNITDMSRKSSLPAFLGGLVVGGAGGYFISRGNNPSCGPVNPPNRIANGGGVLFSIPLRTGR